MTNETRENPIQVAMRGYAVWAAKPHNRKWVRLIDGTPIPNDLPVCIAMEFVAKCRAELVIAQDVPA